MLVLVEQVVHLPEAALQRRGLGRLRRADRVRMDLREREVAEDESQVVAQRLLEALDDAVGAPAVRALVVAVLHQRDGRAGASLDVIARAHLGPEMAHRFSRCRLSSASRIPSAPGLTARGET